MQFIEEQKIINKRRPKKELSAKEEMQELKLRLGLLNLDIEDRFELSQSHVT